MTRTVVFSDEAIVKELDEGFVSAWVNVAPRTRFPASANRYVDRTYCERFPLGTGDDNIMAVFATPGGIVLSAVPGYLDRKRFEEEMKFALDLWEKTREPGTTRLRNHVLGTFREAHARRARATEATAEGDFVARAHDWLAGGSASGFTRIERLVHGPTSD